MLSTMPKVYIIYLIKSFQQSGEASYYYLHFIPEAQRGHVTWSVLNS